MEQECSMNHQHKYHVILPETLEETEDLPLVIILDAHGNGKMAVEKFQDAVLQFPCIIAGSDLIRNNYSGFERGISELLSDLKSKYNVDNQQIVIAGFSGGARMAYYYALNHNVRGVLMCGAGPGKQLPSCPVYAITGMGDFNFSEQYYRPDLSALNNHQFTADYFHGIHEWPDAQLIRDGLFFLFKDSKYIIPLRKNRTLELISLSDSLDKTGDALLAWKALEKGAKISISKHQKNVLMEEAEVLLNDQHFKKMISNLETDLVKESKMQQAYAKHLMSSNIDWWKKELDLLKNKIEGTDPGIARDHFLRIKGYMGIMLYSVVNQMSQNDPQNSQLQSILDIYTYAEPENPDPCFFQALIFCKTGRTVECEQYLNKALELGFSDWKRLEKEFPLDIISKLNN